MMMMMMMMMIPLLLPSWQHGKKRPKSSCFQQLLKFLPVLVVLLMLALHQHDIVAVNAAASAADSPLVTAFLAKKTRPSTISGSQSISFHWKPDDCKRRILCKTNDDDDDDDATFSWQKNQPGGRLPWRRLDVNSLLALRGGGGHQLSLSSLLSSSFSTPLSSQSLQDESGCSGSSGSLSISSMLQTAVQSLLDMVQGLSPSVASALRSLFKSVERFLGIHLLPPPPVKKTTKKKSNKGKNQKVSSKQTKSKTYDDESAVKTGKKKKSKTKSLASANDDSDEAVSATTTKSTKKKSKTTSSTSSYNADGTTKKKSKPSAAIAGHLKKPLATSSPNYRIQRELQAFLKDPPPNLSVKVGSKNIRVWIVTMHGAQNTIYEGEVFQLRIAFPAQYPTVPPSVYFLPPHIPLHEHVYTNGDICLSLLGADWRPTMTAQSIAVSILSILSSAQSKSLPMDNARHAQNKPGQYQQDWVYHDDNC